jgi:hypothetical protein
MSRQTAKFAVEQRQHLLRHFWVPGFHRLKGASYIIHGWLLHLDRLRGSSIRRSEFFAVRG